MSLKTQWFALLILLSPMVLLADAEIRPGYFLTSEVGKTNGDSHLVTSIIGGDQARLAYGFNKSLESQITVKVGSVKYHLTRLGLFQFAVIGNVGPTKETVKVPVSIKTELFILSLAPRLKYAFTSNSDPIAEIEACGGILLGPSSSWGVLAAEVKQDFDDKKATLYNAGIVFMPYSQITVPFYFLTGSDKTGAQIGIQRFVAHLGFKI